MPPNDDGSVINKFVTTLLLVLIVLGVTPGAAQEAAPSVNTADNIEMLMANGRSLLQQKQYDLALHNFETVLNRDKSNAEAYYYAGTIYIIQKQTQKGLEYIERSVSLAPNNLRLRFILAETYENLSFMDKAVDMYQKVEKMAPGSQEARESNKRTHMLKGKKYGEQGKFDLALREFSSVLTEYPNDVPALMNKGLTLSFMGRFNEAQTVLEKALMIQPDNELLHEYLGDVFDKNGDAGRSKEQYEKALQLAPHDSPTFKQATVKLALINGAELLAKGRLAEAQREFDKVLAAEPRNPIARFSLAAVYHGLGDMAHAQQLLHSLVEEYPDNLDVRLRLGALYLELGRLDDAAHELEDVIDRAKDTPQARSAAKLLDNIRSTEKGSATLGMSVDEQITLYKTILQENPDDRQVWLDLGLLYIKLQRRDEARKAFEQVIRLDPNDPRALAILAGLYEDTDLTDKAINTYNRALELEKNPSQRENLQRQLAMAGAKQAFAEGRLEDAEERFKAILGKDNGNYIAHFSLALIYSKIGKIEQAIPEYQEVIKIVPGHLSARLNLAVAYEQLGREEDAISEYRIVARSGAPNISDMAKKRLAALMKQVGGFSYSLGYSLNFDSNSNLSSSHPIEELRSDAAGSISYKRKISYKKLYWGFNFSPTYSVYHQQQFDFLQLDAGPFVNATWRGIEFSGNYDYSQTDSVLVQKNYNRSNSLYVDALKRFKMRSLLPFLTATEQQEETPSVWRINGSYRNFKSDPSPIYDSNSYSVGILLNQGSSSGWSWTGNYFYSNNQNLNSIGSDFAYTSHGVSLQLSKTITPKLNANMAYGFIYSSYKNPDSVTKFTKFRINKFNSISTRLNYTVNDSLRLYGNLVYQNNNSNLPTGFILSAEDASTLVGIQSPSLGDYHKYGLTAGLALSF